STIVKDALLPVLTTTVSLAVMFAIMWRLDPMLTLLSLAGVPCIVLLFRRYPEPMLERSHRQQEAEGEQYVVIEETLSAIPVVQAFAREDDADRRYRATTHE